jgi:inositol oxygenase
MILATLIHDMGKILCVYVLFIPKFETSKFILLSFTHAQGEPQYAVVGDTFPVGCRYSEKIVFSEFFKLNPDYKTEKYQTELGIYERGCGLDNVHLS